MEIRKLIRNHTVFLNLVSPICRLWVQEFAICDPNIGFYASKSSLGTPPEGWKPEMSFKNYEHRVSKAFENKGACHGL